MFGDCQVMCSNVLGGGGNLNMVCSSSSENLFSSSPLTNPNFNSISTHHLSSYPPTIIPKEEVTRGVESGSGSEQVELEGGVSGTEQDPFDIDQQHQANPNNKKKRYHRHTTRQIQEMESLFKECPHPDDKQRMRLSQELGLKPRQVKFWFQNRRTQMKAQQDRSDNVILRAENDNLRNENYRLQAALRNIVCPNCGGPSILGEISFDEQHLRHENSRLKDELERVCYLTSHYTGRPSQAIGHPPPLLPPSLELDMNIYSRQFQDPMSESRSDMILPMPLMHPEDSQLFSASQGSDLLLSDEEQSLALQLAASSMDELVKMCNVGEPLWIRCGENEGGKEVLSIEEHAKLFPWPIILKSEMSGEDLRTEATRGSAVVIMNSVALVDAFMDADKWIELFPSIVSRARTIQAITTSRRDSAASSSLHLMYAEFQVLSPLVPTRETYFLRYCQQRVEDGAWVIVDFPFDSFRDNVQPSFPKYRRHPSGCIIQDRANGYSVVTWLEHAEVEEKPVYPIFDHLVSSGMAFGANRWLAVLQRQCERLASLMATNVSDLGVIPSLDARKNLMRLSQRMTRTFFVDISSCNNQSWTALSDSADDTVRITTREVTEPGKPYGVILTAVSTTWMPYPHYQVFDFLRDERRRSQLDVLSNGNSLHEVSHIANGSHPGNCISLLRINVASNSSQNVELVLQESCTDDSAGGSLVVFATMDVHAVQLAMSCEDPSSIPLLPLGFVIVPSSHLPNQESSHSSPVHEAPRDAATATAGCLLTVGLQALASDIPTARLNLSAVTAINNHLRNAVHQIRAALSGGADSESCPEPPEQ